MGKVGGVAFQGVAQPSGDLQFSSLTLQYIASNDDGRRLRAVFDADTAYAWLADWQLIPIARYADSPYHATISLFGERSTEDSYDIVYHPSLRNTLLGIRLLHADILLMNVSEYWRMPRFNGEIVLRLEDLRGFFRPMHHHAVGHHREVAPLAHPAGTAELHDVVVLR